MITKARPEKFLGTAHVGTMKAFHDDVIRDGSDHARCKFYF